MSDETNQQTEKYFKYYCEQNASSGNNDIFLFVYLTPLTNSELDKISEPQCTCKQFIQIKYQDILCDIVEQCLSLDIKPRVKTILKEYIYGLELNTDNCIMAISKQTSTMLQSALTDFEPLISTFFNYIIVDPNTNDDIREAAELYLRQSNIKFKFNGRTINSKVGLVCEVLKALIPQKVSPEDFNKEFRISRRQDYKSVKEVLKQNMLTKTNEELSQPSIAQNDPLRMETNQCPKKYKPLPSSTNIYYFSDWNSASIDYFLYTYFRNREGWGLNEEKYCIYVVK